MNENILNPKFGYTFADLFVSDKLKNLSEDFYKYFDKQTFYKAQRQNRINMMVKVKFA